MISSSRHEVMIRTQSIRHFPGVHNFGPAWRAQPQACHQLQPAPTGRSKSQQSSPPGWLAAPRTCSISSQAATSSQRLKGGRAGVQQGLIGPLLMGDLSRKPSGEFQDLPLTTSGTLKHLGSSLRCALASPGARMVAMGDHL